MRIITGSKRGKKLVTLEGEQVRPTTDRVKESLFNILQFQLEGRKFLDLFAGSGQIGLEALSRGAALCVFVDSAEQALPLVAQRMNPGGVILCEHPKDEALPEAAGAFRLHKTYRYGKIMLTSYRQPVEGEDGQ